MGTALYLKIGTGNQIVGECRDPHHVGWIKLEDLIISSRVQAIGTNSSPDGFMCTIKKVVDLTSTAFMDAARLGQTFDVFTLDIADETTGLAERRVEFQKVTVWNFSISPEKKGDLPIENISCGFVSLKVNHNPVPDDAIEQVLLLLARWWVKKATK